MGPLGCPPEEELELTGFLAAVDATTVIERLVDAAATVSSACYAGLVEVDTVDEHSVLKRLHAARGDADRFRDWLHGCGVLKILSTSSDPVRLACDPEGGDPGFLAVPIPLGTRRQAYLWVAGRSFGDHEEELMARLATAGGRLLEAVCGIEEAVRMLRAVHAFTPPTKRGQ